MLSMVDDMWRTYRDSRNNEVCDCGRGFKRFNGETQCMQCILEYIYETSGN